MCLRPKRVFMSATESDAAHHKSLVIYALGSWQKHQVHAHRAASSLALQEHHLRAIDAAWDQALQRPGIHLFNGPMCRLESFSLQRDKLDLRLSVTDYKHFLGSNAAHPQWADDYGPTVMANPLGTSVIICSLDGFLVCGKRSQAVALYPGFAHPFGGTLEPDKHGEPPSLIDDIKRELSEELHLVEENYLAFYTIGLIEDRHLRQPELINYAAVNLTVEQLIAQTDRLEHHGCWSIPDTAEAVAHTLKSDATLTPVLDGTLLCYGAWKFGELWFAQHQQARHRDQRSTR
jgi:hypothetical protein